MHASMHCAPTIFPVCCLLCTVRLCINLRCALLAALRPLWLRSGRLGPTWVSSSSSSKGGGVGAVGMGPGHQGQAQGQGQGRLSLSLLEENARLRQEINALRGQSSGLGQVHEPTRTGGGGAIGEAGAAAGTGGSTSSGGATGLSAGEAHDD